VREAATIRGKIIFLATQTPLQSSSQSLPNQTLLRALRSVLVVHHDDNALESYLQRHPEITIDTLPALKMMRLEFESNALARQVMTELAIGRDKFAQWIPLGRVAHVDEIMGPALFLASRASSYVTGTTLFADGGYMQHLVRYKPEG
jgi:hypothetical protein